MGSAIVGLIAFPFDLTPSMEGALRFELLVRRMESILPVLQNLLPILVFYWFTVLLPMYIFPRMRPLISSSLKASALLIGIVCWWQSFIVTYRLLGGAVLIAGTLFMGIGVVPAALFATASTNDGLTFGEIMVTLVLTVAARFLAKAITSRASRVKPVPMSNYEA
jgi:hypothetical protein